MADNCGAVTRSWNREIGGLTWRYELLPHFVEKAWIGRSTSREILAGVSFDTALNSLFPDTSLVCGTHHS